MVAGVLPVLTMVETGRTMRTRRLLAGAAAGVTALTLIGGCAAQQIKRLEPKLELRSAAQHLAAAKQAGFTLRITGSADDLAAGLKAQAAKDGDRDAMSADDVATLRKLFTSSVTVAYDQAGDGAADDRMSMAATIDDVTGTEIRLIDGTLYAKAPVADLAEKLGAGEVGAMRQEMVGAMPALGAFFDGRWVAVDVKAATRDTGLPGSTADPARTMAEVRTSAQNLVEGASVARDPADPKHLIVTSSTTKAYQEMKRLVAAVGQGLDKMVDESGKPPKDRPIVLDLWTDQGKLLAAEVNVLQFIDGATGRAAIRLEMTTGAPITAPPDATKVDPGAMAGLAVSPPGGGVKAEAQALGFEAQAIAESQKGDPRKVLRTVIAELDGSGIKATIVRRGVAEVTSGGKTVCVTVPKSYDKEPTVIDGRC
jgi:hypothetical protein